jgi:hypothetical protein
MYFHHGKDSVRLYKRHHEMPKASFSDLMNLDMATNEDVIRTGCDERNSIPDDLRKEK